ncbi:MAG: FAD-dependent oxidoreductase [Flavobacteriales bacterium]
MPNKKLVILGAGLAGSLLSILLAKRGYKVEIYEKRPDMRKKDISAGRSINLALSDRGIVSLKKAGNKIKEEVMEQAIPMKGRMIHNESGETNLQPYSGREGEYINSISRSGLNVILMNHAEKMGVNIYFNYKCTGMEWNTGSAIFKNEINGKESHIKADVIFGADGAGSAIREEMRKNSQELGFSYSQEFLSHGYKELHIPPTENNNYRIKKNALHIWPRKSFMLIALPNLDGSFTVTLFQSFNGTQGLSELEKDNEIAKRFFNEYFPDAVKHMSDFIKDFNENPSSNLATLKCYPWQVNGKVLLIGDAAHAMVPFYGQGMNCSFEDCIVLDDLIDKYEGNWEKIFKTFQKQRKKDTDAIQDMALENFYEMRDHVAGPIFQKKRELEMKLEKEFPDYSSKYSLVTFKEDTPYSTAMQKGKAQDEILMNICRNTKDVSSLDPTEVIKRLKDL